MRVFIEETGVPDELVDKRIYDAFEFDAVPRKGDTIETVEHGMHAALEVLDVTWKQGDGGFTPVLRVRRET